MISLSISNKMNITKMATNNPPSDTFVILTTHKDIVIQIRISDIAEYHNANFVGLFDMK